MILEVDKLQIHYSTRDGVARAAKHPSDGDKNVRHGRIVSAEARAGDARRTDKALQRLPVVDNGRPVGVVSLGDLAVERDRRSALGEISAARPNH